KLFCYLFKLPPGSRGVENPATLVCFRRNSWGSVRARKNGPMIRGFAAVNAGAARVSRPMSQDRVGVQRDAAHGGARLFFDAGLAIAAAAPVGKNESGFHGLFELVVILCFVSVGAAECQRLVKKRLVNLSKQLF